MSKKKNAKFGHLLISNVRIGSHEFQVQHYMFLPVDLTRMDEQLMSEVLATPKIYKEFVYGAMSELTENERNIVRDTHLETKEEATVILIGIHRLKKNKGNWELADQDSLNVVLKKHDQPKPEEPKEVFIPDGESI